MLDKLNSQISNIYFLDFINIIKQNKLYNLGLANIYLL